MGVGAGVEGGVSMLSQKYLANTQHLPKKKLKVGEEPPLNSPLFIFNP